MTFLEPFAGMDVCTNDDKKVGRVKQPPGKGDPHVSKYVTIDRPRARDIAVPRSILRVSDDHIVLPFGMTLVQGAPNVSVRGLPMSSEEESVLDSCYSLWTGEAGDPSQGRGSSAPDGPATSSEEPTMVELTGLGSLLSEGREL